MFDNLLPLAGVPGRGPVPGPRAGAPGRGPGPAQVAQALPERQYWEWATRSALLRPRALGLGIGTSAPLTLQ